ncbi:MAG: tetratricopeptide repeat protein [Deltaproteobacteria bacterium]|nr:tetratricopeptide repeat protein [Deltaproteobacteria bacterium]
MAKKRVTRKQLLKEPDEFLTFTEKAVLFIKEHDRKFKFIAGTIGVIILIYLGVNTGMGYINKKGQSAYNLAFRLMSAQNTDLSPESEEVKQAGELFQEVLDDYSLSRVRQLALPELAYVKMVEKKYDEAIPLYQEFLDKAPEKSPYQSLARIAIAACHEAKGEFEQAIEILNQVTAHADDLFKEQALFSLARIYRLAGQKDQAKEILQEFVEKYENSPFLPLAKAHLQEFRPEPS